MAFVGGAETVEVDLRVQQVLEILFKAIIWIIGGIQFLCKNFTLIKGIVSEVTGFVDVGEGLLGRKIVLEPASVLDGIQFSRVDKFDVVEQFIMEVFTNTKVFNFAIVL